MCILGIGIYNCAWLIPAVDEVAIVGSRMGR
jgi:hypothetical protein